MTFILWLAIAIAVLVLWSLWGRDWLKSRNWRWSNAFFAWIEPLEIKLWKNSKTIFIARLKMLTGMLLTLGAQTGKIDITPIMPLVPERWRGSASFAWNLLPLALTIMGWLDEKLRNDTTLPIEVVAAPEAVKAALPEVQHIEEAKVAAVEAVKEASAVTT